LRLWDQNDEEKPQVDDLESLHQLLSKTRLKNACKTRIITLSKEMDNLNTQTEVEDRSWWGLDRMQIL
jgi:hypothetical protein